MRHVILITLVGLLWRYSVSLSETITLFLSNAVNRETPVNQRADKIRKCAKLISLNTKDKSLKSACSALRKQKTNSLVISAMEEAENVLWSQRRSSNE